MVEFDAIGVCWRGDGGLLSAQLAALVGVDFPRVVRVLARPFGGEGEVLVDGFAEVVGNVVDKPSVELVAFARRVGGGALDPSVRVVDLLRVRCLASSCRVEADCVTGFCAGASGQGLIDGVAETFGERLIVLFANDGNGGFSGFVGGYVCSPGAADLAKCQCFAVQAG